MSCWTPLSFPSYSGDTFPDHWSEAETEKMKLEYRAKSGRKPVTPKNLSSWVRSAGKRELRWQFWELASGSSRLSLTCFWQRWWLDFRYGWDLGHPPHQAMPRSCQAEFCPAHLFAAPSCRPWSVASASKPTAAREADRARELPTLEFLYEILLFQHNSNLGFTLEQPYGSQLCSQTVQSRLRDNGGIRTWRLDQCVLGAQDETGAPVRKATALLTYRRLKMVIKRCAIIEVEPMGVLQGKVRGVNRTAMAAAYPKRLVSVVWPRPVVHSPPGFSSLMQALAPTTALDARHVLHLRALSTWQGSSSRM